MQARIGVDLLHIIQFAADVRLHRDQRRDRADRLQHLGLCVQRHRQACADDGGDAAVLVLYPDHAQAGRRFLRHDDVAVDAGQLRLQAEHQLAALRLDQQFRRAGQQFDARVRVGQRKHQRVANQCRQHLVLIEFVALF